jgi:hypothetical protein
MNGAVCVVLTGFFAGLLGSSLRLVLEGPKAAFRSCATVAAAAGIICGAFGPAMGMNLIQGFFAVAFGIGLTYWHSVTYEYGFRQAVAVAPEVR